MYVCILEFHDIPGVYLPLCTINLYQIPLYEEL